MRIRPAAAHLFVGADAHIGPTECTIFTKIFGEVAASQRADVGIGPYTEMGRRIRVCRSFSQKTLHSAGGQSRPPLQRVRRVVVGADDSVGPLRSYKFAVDSRKNGAFCRADVGIGLYGQAGKCIRIRRRFSIIRCILPGGAEPRPYQLRLNFNDFT